MNIKYSDEFRRALKIVGIILIVSALILIILSGIHESPWQEEHTITLESNDSYGPDINVEQGRSVKLHYKVIEGPDTVRIKVQYEDLNNEVVNLTETDGRELTFTSKGDFRYWFRFINYGNESTTIQYEIIFFAYTGNIEYFYLALICFVMSAIILVSSSIKKKEIKNNNNKD